MAHNTHTLTTQTSRLIGKSDTRYEPQVIQASTLTAHPIRSGKDTTITNIVQHNGHDDVLPTITSNTRIEIERYILKGTTTLYGKLLRVGDNPAHAVLTLLDGTTKVCRVENLTLAKQLAQRLYERVGVRGVAQWDARDLSLQEFRIESLLEYQPVSLSEAVSVLQEAVGQYYNDIDVEGDLAELRGYGEDE